MPIILSETEERNWLNGKLETILVSLMYKLLCLSDGSFFVLPTYPQFMKKIPNFYVNNLRVSTNKACFLCSRALGKFSFLWYNVITIHYMLCTVSIIK